MLLILGFLPVKNSNISKIFKISKLFKDFILFNLTLNFKNLILGILKTLNIFNRVKYKPVLL